MNMRFQSGAIMALQEASEAYLVGLLEDSQHVRYPCKEGHHYAQGYPVGTPHQRGEELKALTGLIIFGPFRDHHILQKGVYL